MKVYAPSYYKKFKCIADKCKHNCCIGWEIDIDEDTYAYYTSIGGVLGKRLKKHITVREDGTCFALDEQKRCPFLNSEGLCDLICTLGEDALCQICADHPRFRNFFDSREEVGIGLCCEAATELVVKQQEKMELVLLWDDACDLACSEEEATFFSFRERVFSILQNRKVCLQNRITDLCKTLDVVLSEQSMRQWISFYERLELLDMAWLQRLKCAQENTYWPEETMQEQLLCYFIFRHLADGWQDGDWKGRIAFSIHAVWFLSTLSENEADFLELCRMYSAEIEYSEENMQNILSACVAT